MSMMWICGYVDTLQAPEEAGGQREREERGESCLPPDSRSDRSHSYTRYRHSICKLSALQLGPAFMRFII